MKDISFFFLKKYFLASKIGGRGPRSSFANACGGDGSTSTLNQHQDNNLRPSVTPENTPFNVGSPRTLEDMILQLEVEEDIIRRGRLRDGTHDDFENDGDDEDKFYNQPVRMSCVNSSDILRSARKALNQYPRFSLDGKDAMYMSSFRRQFGASPNMVRQEGQRSRRPSPMGLERKGLPHMVAGENVVWCKTGVVARLMGLEMIPVPVKGKTGKDKLGTLLKRERLRRRDRTEASSSSGGFNVLRV